MSLFIATLFIDSRLKLAMPEKCILLEDKVGLKNKWDPVTPGLCTEELIHRGSLLVELTETEARETYQYFTNKLPLNYKKYSDDSAKLYCNPVDVRQLNDKQFSFLLGVKLPFDQYKALNILNWVEKLRVGCGVNVTIPTIPHPVRGIIQYIGPLLGEEGTKFGIELLVSQCVLKISLVSLISLIHNPVNNVLLGEERGRRQ